MVEFDTTTVGTPPGDLQKIVLLKRRAWAIDCMETYKQASIRGAGSDHAAKAAIASLFFDLQPGLKRTLSEKDYRLLTDLFIADNDSEFSAYQEAFVTINEWLDQMNIIKVDTKKRYDPGIAEEENEAHDL